MMTVSIPTARDFWKVVALFAYRRWARPGEKKPVGIPNNRDPDAPCEGFEPLPGWKLPVWNDCMTDGHYLCGECCHKKPVEDETE